MGCCKCFSAGSQEVSYKDDKTGKQKSFKATKKELDAVRRASTMNIELGNLQATAKKFDDFHKPPKDATKLKQWNADKKKADTELKTHRDSLFKYIQSDDYKGARNSIQKKMGDTKLNIDTFMKDCAAGTDKSIKKAHSAYYDFMSYPEDNVGHQYTPLISDKYYDGYGSYDHYNSDYALMIAMASIIFIGCCCMIIIVSIICGFVSGKFYEKTKNTKSGRHRYKYDQVTVNEEQV